MQSEHKHEIIKCSCGNVISQCRCMASSKNIRVLEKGCGQCKANDAIKPSKTVAALDCTIIV